MEHGSRLCSGSPYRRRRITWLILLILGVTFYYGAPWELPGYLKDVDGLSRANVVKHAQDANTTTTDEIYGLLYLVTAPDHRQLSPSADVDSGKPIALGLYGGGNEDLAWPAEAESIDRQFPIVVFSKTGCPYSAKAKTLLGTYDLDPAPKVVEVDLRDDKDVIKALLTRLTDRSTFPNVLVRGKSIGGSDELQDLHLSGKLRRIIENAGVKVRAVL